MRTVRSQRCGECSNFIRRRSFLLPPTLCNSSFEGRRPAKTQPGSTQHRAHGSCEKQLAFHSRDLRQAITGGEQESGLSEGRRGCPIVHILSETATEFTATTLHVVAGWQIAGPLADCQTLDLRLARSCSNFAHHRPSLTIQRLVLSRQAPHRCRQAE